MSHRMLAGAWRRTRGQSVVEFALVLPLFLLIILGVVEVGYAILDDHVVTKLAREGSNLISRDTTLQDAVTAMRQMSARPVDFDRGSSKIIFSVVRRIATTGAANYNRDVLYQRTEYGGYSATSALTTRGTGSFGGGPDYKASNPDSDTNLQVTNLPPGLLLLGGSVYVTEIYSAHPLITPLDRLGVHVPTQLYSIAYF